MISRPECASLEYCSLADLEAENAELRQQLEAATAPAFRSSDGSMMGTVTPAAVFDPSLESVEGEAGEVVGKLNNAMSRLTDIYGIDAPEVWAIRDAADLIRRQAWELEAARTGGYEV